MTKKQATPHTEARRLLAAGFTQPVRVQVITSSDSALGKVIAPTPEGLATTSNTLQYGEIVTHELSSMAALGALIAGLGPQQALCLSTSDYRPDPSDGEPQAICSQHLTKINPGAITRSLDHLRYEQGQPALILFDRDNGDGEAMTQSRALAILGEMLPGFDALGYVSTHSSSSFISDADGTVLRGEGNTHTLMAAADGADIPRFKAALEGRLWLAGYGRAFVTSNGNFLARTVFDMAVFSPERLVYEGPPTLTGGLTQSRPPPTVGEGLFIDTRAVADLTLAELAEVATLHAKARSDAADRMAAAAAKYVEREVPKLVAATKARMLKDGATEADLAATLPSIEAEAGEAVLARSEGFLKDSDLLYFDHMKGQPVTVLQARTDPSFMGRALADPAEPDYQGRPGSITKGKAMLLRLPSGQIGVHSKAHGGIDYTFADTGADHFDPIPDTPGDAPAPTKSEQWDDPIDVCGAVPPGPPYDLASGLIPAVYMDMVMEFVRMYVHASVEAYAGIFYLAAAVHVRPSVRVRERPGDQGKLYDLNEQAAIVGPSTKGKTSTMEQALGMGDDGPLTRWNQHEQARTRQIRTNMLLATAEGKAGAAERKRIMEEYPIPDIQLNVSSDKELYRNVSANYYHDLPTSFVIDEWSEVYGGSHYRGDDGHAITVFWRQAADNNRHKSKTVSSSNTENERVAANLGFNCTEGDMGAWRGYPEALKNGTMARLSLIAPGKPYEGERSTSINPHPVKRWEDIQRALHELHGLDLQLEPDPEFDAALDAEVSQYSQFAENGDGVTTYLAKLSIRIARHAALLFLVDTLSQGDNPKATAEALMDVASGLGAETIVIPKQYRRRAWQFTQAFLWPQQVHVHTRLAGTGVFRSAIGALQNRIFCNNMKRIKRAEIVGSAGPRSVRGTDDDALMRLLVEGLSWLRPRSAANGKKFDPTRPWTAYTFDVNPKCMAMWELRGDFIRNQHAVAKGQMLTNFAELAARQDDGTRKSQ